MGFINMKTLFKAVKAVTAFLSLSALGYLIYKGYDQPWTGLQDTLITRGNLFPRNFGIGFTTDYSHITLRYGG